MVVSDFLFSFSCSTMSSGEGRVQQAASGEDRVQQPTDNRAAAERPSWSQSGASTSRAGRKKRSQTTWPSDVKSCGRVNSKVAPEDPSVKVRLGRVCGLAARQRVPLTLEHFDDLSWDDKMMLNIRESCTISLRSML
jgi:hypothetical protein